MNAVILTVGLSIGLLIGLCLFALFQMERVTRVDKVRPWRICAKCERTVQVGNVPWEERTYCEDCTAAALKRVA